MRDTALPAPVTFELEASEAKCVARSLNAQFGSLQRWFVIGVSVLNGVNLTWSSAHLFGASAGWLAGGVTALLLGAAILGQFRLEFTLRHARGQTSVCWTVEGIEVERASDPHTSIAWSSVVRACDLDEVLLLICAPRGGGFLRSKTFVIVPKRALPDGGVALWSFLERRLTGSRYLRLPAAKRSMLINTAASA